MARLVRNFRIRPDLERKDFYTVRVFRNREAMHRFWAAQVRTGRLPPGCLSDGEREADFEACVNSWTTYRVRKGGAHRERTSKCGQILFYFDGLGVGVVAHEMTHGALYYAHRRRLNVDRRVRDLWKNDEQLASFCGELVRQFWCKYWVMFPKERFQ